MAIGTPFKDHWTSLKAEEKVELAKRMDSSVDSLSQVAHGHRFASRRFARELSILTGCDPQSVMRPKEQEQAA